MSIIFDTMSEQTLLDRVGSRYSVSERKPTKAEQTRESIFRCALEFFWTQPFRELTVGELMARAGASRPTFYHYFDDLYDLMSALLEGIRGDILSAAKPWFQEAGDPIPLLKESIRGMVRIGYENGPILRAVADAAVSDSQLENAWDNFLLSFDDAVTARIQQQQELGLIAPFPAHSIASALNRLDAALLIDHFGKHPRSDQDEVLRTITRIWCSTLYGVPGD